MHDKPTNHFTITEVDNGWMVEINSRLDRMERGDRRVYNDAHLIAEMLIAFKSKSDDQRVAAEPVKFDELP
jgi:hypothetical protein